MNVTLNSTSLNVTGQTYHISGASQAEKEETTAKQAEESRQVSATSIQGDTLELSEEGKAASAGAGVGAADDADEGTELGGSSAGGVAQVISEAFSGTEETEETEESSSTDLSSYTESELKEMYQNGEITAAEYRQELARRETASGAEDEGLSVLKDSLGEEK